MQLIIHRGTKEVGGNCIEVSAGSTRLILDVGMPLFDSDREAFDNRQFERKSTEELLTDGIIPSVPGLFSEGPTPDAILLSHAHLDHAGLIRRSDPSIPIYSTSGTSKMLLAGSIFAGQPSIPRERHKVLQDKVTVEIGEFRITPFSVDHSIIGCVALLVEADGKSLLYSGDLRLHGRKPSMARELQQSLANRHLDALIIEGTHFGLAEGETINEYELEDQIAELVSKAPGLVLASFSPQHLDRLVGFVRAAIKTGRTFVADAYSAFVLHLISSETAVPVPGRDKEFPVFFPATLTKNESKSAWLEKTCPFLADARIPIEEILADPKKYLMVFRPSMLEHDFQNQLPENVLCVHSRWEGYIEATEWKKTLELIDKAAGRLVQAHTSGHILAQDIVEFVNSISPQMVVPIHSFEPTEFASRMANVRILTDGEVYRIE